MDKKYLALLESDRVSSQTRKVLLARLEPDDPQYVPQALSDALLQILRSLLGRIIPQVSDGTAIDLAARLDKQLALGKGDGWRYATLPSDLEAMRSGLSLLDEYAQKLSAVPFDRLSLEAQDSLLSAIASGRLHSNKLDLKRWFEDLRAAATQLYVSHPQTLARMGYSGIADDPSGFVQIGRGQVEPWEPEPR